MATTKEGEAKEMKMTVGLDPRMERAKRVDYCPSAAVK